MSARMKMASILSYHIKNLGFHCDMSYSTVLYGSELEIRRILMFLIERLPKESLKTNELETSYTRSLIKKINENIQLHLKNLWIPSNLLNNGIRKYEEKQYSIHSFGSSIPIISTPVLTSDSNQHTKGENLL